MGQQACAAIKIIILFIILIVFQRMYNRYVPSYIFVTFIGFASVIITCEISEVEVKNTPAIRAM